MLPFVLIAAIAPYDAIRHAYREVGGIDADRLPFSALASPRLLAFPDRPVYEVAVPSLWPFDRYVALVDAETGKIVKKTNHTRSLSSLLRVYAPVPAHGFISL